MQIWLEWTLSGSWDKFLVGHIWFHWVAQCKITQFFFFSITFAFIGEFYRDGSIPSSKRMIHLRTRCVLRTSGTIVGLLRLFPVLKSVWVAEDYGNWIFNYYGTVRQLLITAHWRCSKLRITGHWWDIFLKSFRCVENFTALAVLSFSR